MRRSAIIEHMFYDGRDRDGHDLEAAILRLLLITYPDRLTVAELGRELAGLAECRAAVADAVDRLERAGLVQRHGELTSLSRAARYFDRLRVY